MALHRLGSVTIGVPNVAETAAYYEDFGLTPLGQDRFATTDGGEQLRVVHAPRRQVVEITIGAEDQDDIDRIARQIDRLDLAASVTEGRVEALEPIAGFKAVVQVMPHLAQEPIPATPYNGPGRIDRGTGRAPGILRDERVRPHKLGHVVIGSTDQAATQKFFTDGIGLKVSDVIPSLAAFMRCSTDHHNVLVQQAPVNFLHHTSWQVAHSLFNWGPPPPPSFVLPEDLAAHMTGSHHAG
ncbi:hypothetical protein ACFTWF_33695 [Rhodococcus sp. NPDC056960]|uniref:hypothetical protein n=1 Tax=Rhodococcus TaxID=1827 RepID=UPI003633B452